jgi:hypothetical protein
LAQLGILVPSLAPLAQIVMQSKQDMGAGGQPIDQKAVERASNLQQAMNRLKISMDEAFVAIDKRFNLSGITTKLVNFVIGLADAMSKLTPAVEGLLNGVKTVWQWLEQHTFVGALETWFAEAWTTVSSWLGDNGGMNLSNWFNKTFEGVAKWLDEHSLADAPITWLADALSGVFKWLYLDEHSLAFKINEWLTDALVAVGRWLTNDPLFQKLIDWLDGIFPGLRKWWDEHDLGQMFKDAMEAYRLAILQFLKDGWKLGEMIITALADGITAISKYFQGEGNIGSVLYNWAKSGYDKFMAVINGFSLADTLSSWLGSAIDAAKNLLAKANPMNWFGSSGTTSTTTTGARAATPATPVTAAAVARDAAAAADAMAQMDQRRAGLTASRMTPEEYYAQSVNILKDAVALLIDLNEKSDKMLNITDENNDQVVRAIVRSGQYLHR